MNYFYILYPHCYNVSDHELFLYPFPPLLQCFRSWTISISFSPIVAVFQSMKYLFPHSCSVSVHALFLYILFSIFTLFQIMNCFYILSPIVAMCPFMNYFCILVPIVTMFQIMNGVFLYLFPHYCNVFFPIVAMFQIMNYVYISVSFSPLLQCFRSWTMYFCILFPIVAMFQIMNYVFLYPFSHCCNVSVHELFLYPFARCYNVSDHEQMGRRRQSGESVAAVCQTLDHSRGASPWSGPQHSNSHAEFRPPIPTPPVGDSWRSRHELSFLPFWPLCFSLCSPAVCTFSTFSVQNDCSASVHQADVFFNLCNLWVFFL